MIYNRSDSSIHSYATRLWE